jgi:hypothetical protein
MDSLKELKNLPEEKQNKIAAEFGSAEGLFKKIFDLHAESHYLNKKKPKDYLPRIIEIRDELYRVEDKLDEFGLVGYKIITRISDDLAEVEISKLVDELKTNLKQYGPSSDEMKGWIKKHFEVV